jgi:hypothetical protein
LILLIIKQYSPLKLETAGDVCSLAAVVSAAVMRNPTSQETHSVSITKPNRLMLIREIIAVCCENHTGHINTLCVCAKCGI